MASKKSTLQFVVGGNVESSVLISNNILEPPSAGTRKSRRRNIALDNDDSDEGFSPKIEKKTPKDTASSVSKANADEGKSSTSKSRKKAEPAASKGKKSEPPKASSKSKSKRGSKKKGGKNDSDDSASRDEEMSTSRSKVAPIDEDDMDEEEMMLGDDDDEMMGDDGELRYDESESGMNVGIGGEDDDDMEDESIYSGLPRIGKKEKIDPQSIDLNKLTRRQRSALKSQGADIAAEEELLQLPDKKPRKKKSDFLSEDDQVKKLEQANKRRMHTQKMVEEQKKQIVDRILNEAGRKQRMRKEKEEQDDLKKQNYKYRVLPEGEVGIKYISKRDGNFLVLPSTMIATDLLGNLSAWQPSKKQY